MEVKNSQRPDLTILPSLILIISFFSFFIGKIKPDLLSNFLNTDLGLLSGREFYDKFQYIVILLLIPLPFFSSKKIRAFLKNKLISRIFIFLTTLSLFLWVDPYVALPNVTSLSIGLIINFACLFCYFYKNKITDYLSSGLIALWTSIFISSVIQIPTYLRDSLHFGYIQEEVLSATTGRYPLVNFLPQYTSFGAYPLLIIKNIIHINPTLFVTSYLVFFQLLATLIVISIPVIANGKRILPLALFLSTSLTFSIHYDLTGPSTYFQSFPIRIIFPSLGILSLFISTCFKEFFKNNYFRILALISIGLISTISIFMNIEFGIPFLLSVLILLLVKEVYFNRVKQALIFILSVFISIIFFRYTIYSIAGEYPNFSQGLFFIKWFGIEGYFSTPIPPFGPHIPGIALFVFSIIISLYIMKDINYSEKKENFKLCISSTLFLTSLWSLLCLPYYLGRSYSSTFFGTYSFNIVLLISILLPLLLISIKKNLFTGFKFTNNYLRNYKYSHPIFILSKTETLSLLAGLILIFSYSSTQLFLPNMLHLTIKSKGIDQITNKNNYYALGEKGINIVSSNIIKLGNEKYLNLPEYKNIPLDKITNIMPSSAIYQHRLGIKSNMVVNSPDYFEREAFSSAQCNYSKNKSSILLYGFTLKALNKNDNCLKYLNLKQSSLFIFNKKSIKKVVQRNKINPYSIYLIVSDN